MTLALPVLISPSTSPDSLANSILTFSGSSAVIPLDQALDAASFPDADYAIRIITTVPNATGGTDEIETYGYLQRSTEGDVLVGVGGPDGQVPIPLVDIETPWPLEFGKSWTVENISWEDQILSALGMAGPELLLAELLLPEETISGQLDLQFAVDAWGEIQLPAGTFDCLRLHQTGSIVLSLRGQRAVLVFGWNDIRDRFLCLGCSWDWGRRHSRRN